MRLAAPQQLLLALEPPRLKSIEIAWNQVKSGGQVTGGHHPPLFPGNGVAPAHQFSARATV